MSEANDVRGADDGQSPQLPPMSIDRLARALMYITRSGANHHSQSLQLA